MRASLILAALAGSAIATPLVIKRQDIDYDAIEAELAQEAAAPGGAPIGGGSDLPDYDSDQAAADVAAEDSTPTKLRARAQCTPLPKGSGPATKPDTAAAFWANSVYPNTANAAKSVPGYTLVAGPIQNSTNAKTYLGYTTLTSFFPVDCQQKCDAADSCYGFNIYFERDPSISACDTNQDPPSTVNIKCAFYGSALDASSALNNGQFRNKFRVAIAGSLVYSKNSAPDAIPGFSGPVEFGGAINAPREEGTYMTQKFVAGPYNPKICAQKCVDTTAYNKRTSNGGSYNTCRFFNAYLISKNYVPQGTQCSFYTKSYGKKYATNYDQYRPGNNYWSNSQSYGYTLIE